MAFVRWSAESELYVFDNSKMSKVVCFLCPLSDSMSRLPSRNEFATRSLSEMLAHVKVHREAEHDAPEWLEQELTEHWPYENDLPVEE